MTCRWLSWMLWSVAVLLALLEAWVSHARHFDLEAVPGFYVLFGWLSAVALGVLTRVLARLLQREEGDHAC